MARIAYLYSGFLIAIFDYCSDSISAGVATGIDRMDRPNPFFSQSPQQLTRCVEEIIEAVTQWPRKNRRDYRHFATGPLGEFAETGVRIDAKVTSEISKPFFMTALRARYGVRSGGPNCRARVQTAWPRPTVPFMDVSVPATVPRLVFPPPQDALVIVVSEETGIGFSGDERPASSQYFRGTIAKTFNRHWLNPPLYGNGRDTETKRRRDGQAGTNKHLNGIA